jgi:hypothetical protein
MQKQAKLTLQNIVKLVDTRRDTEINALIAEVHHNAAENRRVDLKLIKTDLKGL